MITYVILSTWIVYTSTSYRLAAVVAVNCSSICAFLGIAPLHLEIASWRSMLAVVLVSTLARMIGKHFGDRTEGYSIHTPIYQGRNKNARYIRTWSIYLFFLCCAHCSYYMLDIAIITCTQAIFVATGLHNLLLTTEDIGFLIVCLQMTSVANEILENPFHVSEVGRQCPEWEVDVLGTSERSHSYLPSDYLRSDTSRPCITEFQRFKTSKSSGYQPPAATLRASKLHRKRAVSPKLKQS